MIELIILIVLTAAIAFGAGCMFYRWNVKRDPAKLERWAAEIKAKADPLEQALLDKLDEYRKKGTP